MKERLVIIIIAIITGLFITTAGFFIYQSTKKGNDNIDRVKKTTSTVPTPSSQSSLFVKVIEPSDESLTTKRTLSVKGTTNPENIVIVSTNIEDVTGKPTTDGNFSLTVDISAGANVIVTRSISPNGDSVEDKKTVTYSTEEF